ncbi:MAG: hypothetical protein J7K20_06445, partial [Thermodesulfobacterium sp.]|nr:hypothetical protein [Thermodesulfobacterium sp.]
TELIDLNLSSIVISAKRYIYLQNINEIFMEFLIKLSEAIYFKSCLLLNINSVNKENSEDLEESNLKENLMEKRPNYYRALSLERILFEKIFLTKVSEDVLDNFDNKNFLGLGQKGLILRAILSVLKREGVKEEILKNFSAYSIEFYLESLKDYLEKKISFSFKELIEEKLNKEENEKLLGVVYYFLSLLFLCLEDFCYMIQNSENEDIIIFSKNVALNS